MSVIAVRGIPARWSLHNLVLAVAKSIKGHFEALNFARCKGPFKTAYLKLSPKLDPQRVVESINSSSHKQCKLTAIIPDHVPNLPVASKPIGLSLKLKRKFKIPTIEDPEKILVAVHSEILVELQSKYTGLYNLSKKTGHKLMAEIARIVFERLKHIMETNEEATENCFKLSKSYRKAHPHFADFQLVLSTLHAVEDAAAGARTQLTEQQLEQAVRAEPLAIGNIPFEKVKKACEKYSEKIIKKIKEHINALKTDAELDKGNEDEIARNRVREELKKISPYMGMIVSQVVSNNFVPEKTPFHRMRIYGEPFLPPREVMSSLLKRHRAVHITRSDRICNMIKFNVPLQQYASIVAMDGTVISGAKLVVRSSDIPTYSPSDAMMEELKATLNMGDAQNEPEMDDDAMMEDWNEEL